MMLVYALCSGTMLAAVIMVNEAFNSNKSCNSENVINAVALVVHNSEVV